MPSDARYTQAVAAMARPIAEFRAVLLGALTQAEGFLVEQAAGKPQRAARAGVELGAFAAGRIDAARFAELFPSFPPVGAAAIAAMHRAVATLQSIRDRGDSAFLLDLPRGGRLGAAVGDALAEIGRGFGAVILADVVRGGRYQPGEHDRLLDPLEFRAWSKAARRYAPPVIVSLDGADLHVGALSDFADGRQKIVLVVRGAAAPAPLARCVTPGTLVLQTTDGSGLDRVADFDGPAVAALMPEGSAVFLHDPAAGREAWQRLTVRTLGELPRHAIGGTSTWQMGEDRTLLGDLGKTPFTIPVSGGTAAPALGADDAVDRIAAWLLTQSGLPGR
jgi:hypothetical protein